MLDALAVVGAALILALLSSFLILPVPDDPVRQSVGRQPDGEADSRME